MLNELLTNSYKHAFGNKPQGTISIIIARDGSDLSLHYTDSGAGNAEAMHSQEKTDTTGSGLGLQLVGLLAEQLKGKLEIKFEPGFQCNLVFPLKTCAT